MEEKLKAREKVFKPVENHQTHLANVVAMEEDFKHRKELDETWQERSLGQAGQINIVILSFPHQGAKQLGTEGKNVGAANMREITWDKCLEIVAQRWADQCVNGHDHIEERYFYKNLLFT